jgi:hypothetical protein
VNIPRNLSFFYDIVEDGRGDNPPEHRKCVMKGCPFRLPGKLDWDVTLVRIVEDTTRTWTEEYPE